MSWLKGFGKGSSKNSNNATTAVGSALVEERKVLPVSNIFLRQQFPVEVKFESEEEIINYILGFLLESTGRDNFNVLVQCGGINRTWNRITSSDKLWKFCLTRFQLDNPDIVLDGCKGSSKDIYFELLKKKRPDRAKSIKEELKALKMQPKKKKLEQVDDIQDYYPIPYKEIQYVEDSSEDAIVWKEEDGRKTIDQATQNRLIAELTSPTFFDAHFLHTFMITFRSFMDPISLFDKLMERYNLPPPTGCTCEEFAKFKVEILDKVRLRVVQTLKYWIENFYTFDFDEEAVKKLNEIISMMNKIKLAGGKSENPHTMILLRALEKVKEEEQGGSKGSDPNLSRYPVTLRPKSSLFGKKKKERILEWPALEIARQITLIDFDIFRKIEPKECLNSNWSKGNQKTKAPNIYKITQTFNTMSAWVGSTIVKLPDIKERAEAIEIFIDIADKLWDLNNFNGMFAVTAGLGMSGVYRLKKSWAVVNEESLKTFERLKEFMSGKAAFAAIRGRIKQVKPPCIPYIGIYLTDLTFIEDGNPKTINGKINFFRSACFASVIRDMQTYQNEKYLFFEVKELKEALLSLQILNEKDMYDQSLIVEPKDTVTNKK